MREIAELTARYVPPGEPSAQEARDCWVQVALREGYREVKFRLKIDPPLAEGQAIAAVTVYLTTYDYDDADLYVHRAEDGWIVNTSEE